MKERLYLALAKAINEAPVLPPCQVTDPELWFGDQDEGYHYTKTAKEFCNQCPVRRQCLEYAIAAPEVFGIWGGTTPRERQNIRVARRAA